MQTTFQVQLYGQISNEWLDLRAFDNEAAAQADRDLLVEIYDSADVAGEFRVIPKG